jgi:hypothetical protein
MEMALDGIVTGSTERVAGIIGFDVFRHVIVEVPAGKATSELYLHEPQTCVCRTPHGIAVLLACA